jgi:hypothetical protein
LIITVYFNDSCSKYLSACRNKIHSPNLSTPFFFRTEERAARRKQARVGLVVFIFFNNELCFVDDKYETYGFVCLCRFSLVAFRS